MEGFCRGCLIKYDEPMELLQYTEKNRRLFVYSTGLQVKRNDTFTFQLCKDCFLNMKQACKFKKNCRTSDKRFKNYIAIKDLGDPVDFCTFLKNSDDTLTFRLPMASGNSTPAAQKCRDDDNESTCTSIRNFMTDILQGEEMPDTEARIIKEVIEEEADVLDDSLDSNWLQDDMSIDTDFRLDFSFSQYSTPRSVNNDHCYTPKQKDDQITFDTINTEKQTKILNDFTNAFKADENIEEISIFVGDVSGIEETERFKNHQELRPLGVDEIDGMETHETDTLKNKQNLKELISDLSIEEIEGMDTSDSTNVETDQNFQELFDFGIEDINSIHKTKINTLEIEEIGDYSKSIAAKSNKSLKEFISNIDIEELGKSENKEAKTNQVFKELMSNFGKDVTDEFEKPDSNDPKSNRNRKELCDSSLDSFSGPEKTESKTLKNAKSLKELCDFSLESFEETAKSGRSTFKNNQNEQELCDLRLNNFDDIANSGIRNDRDVKEICDFSIDGIEKSGSNLYLPSLLDVLEKDRIDTPDFEIPKGVIGSIQSSDDASNNSINIEAMLKDKLEKARIDTPDFEMPKGVIESIQSNNDASNSSLNIEALLKGKPEKARIDTPDYDIPKCVIGSIQSNNDTSNSSINIETLLKYKLEKARIDTPDFDMPKGVIESIQSNNDASNSSLNIEALLKGKPEKARIDTPDYGIAKCVIGSIQSNNDTSNSSINIENLLKYKLEKARIDTPDFDIPKDVIGSKQSNNDASNSSINIETLLKDKPCSIDKNLEEALKKTDNKQYSLEDLLISPPVFPAVSAASTPTITNILFGENLDPTTNAKIEQGLESYQDVQGDIEIFEEFFKNDTKEFYLEDIKRENAGFKSEDWKKPFAIGDVEVANKENDSENIEMEISIDDDKNLAANNNVRPVKKSKKVPMICIAHDEDNDKFNLEKLYCKLCEIRYDTSKALSIHFAKAHRIKIVKPRKRNKNKKIRTKSKIEATINIFDEPADEKFDFENSYCKLCNIEYNSSRALCIHFAKKHNIKIVKPKKVTINRNLELLCFNCGKKSRDYTTHARHVKNCGRKEIVKCDRCQEEFTSQAYLDKHMTCHTNIKRLITGKEYVCTVCGAILHMKYNFDLHMRRHTKDYSVTCKYCDKGFYRQSDLKVHLRNHTGETPYSCKFCPKVYSRRDVLFRHVLIHLDERLFQCDYCGLKCIKKHDLIKHIRNESCRKVKKPVKKKRKIEMVAVKPEKQEEKTKVPKKVIIEVRNKEKIEVSKKGKMKVRKENVIEVLKEEIKVEVVKGVTVLYAKGSDATIMQQLPFLETERSN